MNFEQVFTTLNVNPGELASRSAFPRKNCFFPSHSPWHTGHADSQRKRNKKCLQNLQGKKINSGNLSILIVLITPLKVWVILFFIFFSFFKWCAYGWQWLPSMDVVIDSQLQQIGGFWRVPSCICEHTDSQK